MEEHVKQALEIVKAQAGFRTMTAEELCSMLKAVSAAIQNILPQANSVNSPYTEGMDLGSLARDSGITCLECHKSFKMLTHKHMATHGLTPAEYREKWGYAKNAPLVCKSLQRKRRKKIKDIKLWEKRKKHPAPTA